MNKFDIIVIGAGHAGIEASLAASRMGCSVLLITLKKETIGLMSCNPAIGGVGKGQLVREIDALGGEMAKAADNTGIQFRMLNTSKGPAVWSSRCQVDRRLYQKYMESTVLNQENLVVKEGEVVGLIIEHNKILGVEMLNETIYAKAVVISTGTFLNGVIYIGLDSYPAGRINEPPSIRLAQALRSLGLGMGRLKTCTTARLDGKTIDFSKMIVQEGDDVRRPFSFFTLGAQLPQKPCYLTYTNKKTHRIILKALRDKKLLHIISQGVNPRYCPSIEEKVLRFSERERHQIFVEPEGLDSEEYYTNGLFTFLPKEVQREFIQTIPGMEKAEITKFGYGIEYDYVYPNQLYPTLESKLIKNLFLAGQINGTTGYEEAASQGLIAGINAVKKVGGKEPFILGRDQAYIGVLIDDLVTKGTNEPYRMFTSRCEYRLILREGNADIRLSEFGHKLGLIRKETFDKVKEKKEAIHKGIELLKKKKLKPSPEVNRLFKNFGIPELKKAISFAQLLKRPGINCAHFKELDMNLEKVISENAFSEIEIEIKYEGYINRQKEEVRRMQKIERIKIPSGFEYAKIPALSSEVKEKLNKFKPLTLGQASRISGVNPSAISILWVYLERKNLVK
ncbi:MAG: tRNA uridine-5-carboxymethylaminomethyl(34) synthesis enzyme MnmG [Candidatus Omnitrophica bacterium]|nr:tRNA uridine-5-carboxymethylaminomethyl(34) synthesis enzyme MnmG [Candidatus Omnitrophota bacterium]